MYLIPTRVDQSISSINRRGAVLTRDERRTSVSAANRTALLTFGLRKDFGGEGGGWSSGDMSYLLGVSFLEVGCPMCGDALGVPHVSAGLPGVCCLNVGPNLCAISLVFMNFAGFVLFSFSAISLCISGDLFAASPWVGVPVVGFGSLVAENRGDVAFFSFSAINRCISGDLFVTSLWDGVTGMGLGVHMVCDPLSDLISGLGVDPNLASMGPIPSKSSSPLWSKKSTFEAGGCRNCEMPFRSLSSFL